MYSHFVIRRLGSLSSESFGLFAHQTFSGISYGVVVVVVVVMMMMAGNTHECQIVADRKLSQGREETTISFELLATWGSWSARYLSLADVDGLTALRLTGLPVGRS